MKFFFIIKKLLINIFIFIFSFTLKNFNKLLIIINKTSRLAASLHKLQK